MKPHIRAELSFALSVAIERTQAEVACASNLLRGAAGERDSADDVLALLARVASRLEMIRIALGSSHASPEASP